MKNILIVAALLLLIAGNALAGSGYDRCIQDEKALKAQEAGDCSGLKHLLNPSACFATQKLLKEYKVGKCRQIGLAEHVDFNAPTVLPEKKASPPGASSITEHTEGVSSGIAAEKINRSGEKKVAVEAAQPEGTIEQLKEENARLKAEISHLKAENDLLRKAGH